MNTIGWATIGVQREIPIFQVHVRKCRHSKAMLDTAMEFTLNVPLKKARENGKEDVHTAYFGEIISSYIIGQEAIL